MLAPAKPREAIDHVDPVSYELVASPGAVQARAVYPKKVRDGNDSTAPRVVIPKSPPERWSGQSRSRMVRRFATLDYSPLWQWMDTTPVMVTLTLPKDWEALAPTAKVFRAMVDKFRRSVSYAVAGEQITWPGIWKLEFQRRGAPHAHLLIALPFLVKTTPVSDWVARSWYEIVGSGTAKHLAHGTDLDWAESSQMDDPMRIATYFARHAAPSGSKGYQQAVPDLWKGQSFRFWGYWGLKPQEEASGLSQQQFVQVKRLLRSHYRATHRPSRMFTTRRRWVLDGPNDVSIGHWEQYRGRVGARRVRRIDRRTGEIKYRWVYRRPRSRSLRQSRSVGGFVLSAYGPELAEQLLRAVGASSVAVSDASSLSHASQRGSRDPVDRSSKSGGPLDTPTSKIGEVEEVCDGQR